MKHVQCLNKQLAFIRNKKVKFCYFVYWNLLDVLIVIETIKNSTKFYIFYNFSILKKQKEMKKKTHYTEQEENKRETLKCDSAEKFM